MLVKDYMSKNAITIRDDADYKSAFGIMEEKGIHHLPVINAQEDVVGIITYRDLQIAARCYLEAPVEVSEVMQTPVLTSHANDTLSNAVTLMTENRFGCMPILDEKDHIVGMLTDTDLFHALAEMLKSRA